MGKKLFFFFRIKFRDFDLLYTDILIYIDTQDVFSIKLFKLNAFQRKAFLYGFLTTLKNNK